MTRPFIEIPALDISLDFRWASWAGYEDAGLPAKLARALAEMVELEGGAIANPDEGRQVGHYWLRAPELAPSEEQREAIVAARAAVDAAVEGLGGSFSRVLVIGIGGSALGPQLVADALGGLGQGDARRVEFIDNTDPEGARRALAGDLSDTLAVVISKSGRTPETHNGYLAAAAAYAEAGLSFAEHAMAVTGVGSELGERASAQGWLAQLPMWDWVGGRTSLSSAVGLLPARLQGLDVDALLAGAAAMDAATRAPEPDQNPALLLAAQWYLEAELAGRRAMVVLPYKDRLVLLSKYLQQLVMESLGKRLDRQGQVVHQGLTVYGNKGSTDQHAYVQQLRDGPADFFATFIEVLEDGPDLEVAPGVTSGDYLSGFLAGTRGALSEAGRRSLTISLPRVDARRLGGVIALYERAVGFYASLVDINAYDQPGVEAGKRAAASLLELQGRLLGQLAEGARGSAAQLAAKLGASERDVWHILRHLAANGRARAEGEGLGRVFGAR